MFQSSLLDTVACSQRSISPVMFLVLRVWKSCRSMGKVRQRLIPFVLSLIEEIMNVLFFFASVCE